MVSHKSTCTVSFTSSKSIILDCDCLSIIIGPIVNLVLPVLFGIFSALPSSSILWTLNDFSEVIYRIRPTIHPPCVTTKMFSDSSVPSSAILHKSCIKSRNMIDLRAAIFFNYCTSSDGTYTEETLDSFLYVGKSFSSCRSVLMKWNSIFLSLFMNVRDILALGFSEALISKNEFNTLVPQ